MKKLIRNSIRVLLLVLNSSFLFAQTEGTLIDECGSYFNQNVGVGCYTLNRQSNTGMNNGALGYMSLGSNTTGNNNAALGSNSLLSNTKGNNNTAIGFSALGFNIWGSENVAIWSCNLIQQDKVTLLLDRNLLKITQQVLTISLMAIVQELVMYRVQGIRISEQLPEQRYQTLIMRRPLV